MSDPEVLLLVLLLIYLTECAGWLRRGSVGFLCWRTWRLFHPDRSSEIRVADLCWQTRCRPSDAPSSLTSGRCRFRLGESWLLSLNP